MHKAFRELIGIIENPDYLERKDLTVAWIDTWTKEINRSQLVLNRSQMSTEEHDFTCEHLAKLCGVDALDEGMVDVSVNKNKYEASMVVLSYPKKTSGYPDESA